MDGRSDDHYLKQDIMMKHLLRHSLTIIVIIILLGSCAGNDRSNREADFPVPAESFIVQGGDKRVLILSTGTVFKEMLRSALIEELNGNGISVIVNDMNNAASYDPADFGAVILLSGIQAFKPLPGAVEFITNHDYAGNIVYVSTYTLFAVPYRRFLDKKKIDAITAASKVEKEGVLEEAEENILAEIFEILNEATE